VNYQCPEDEKTYVHRIGRTGRAGSTGVAVTLVDWDDIPRWQLINKALDLGFVDPPETYSTSPWVYTDLDVPENAKGRLPRSQRTREGLDAETLEDLGETGKRNRPTQPGGRDSGGRGDSRGPSDGRSGRFDGRSGRSGDGEQTTGGKSRPRRRTRGTGTVSGGAESTPAAASEPAASEGTATKPRRRRRRGGANRGGGGSESAA
jgi:superfamily II DNA/RNA helicase